MKMKFEDLPFNRPPTAKQLKFIDSICETVPEDLLEAPLTENTKKHFDSARDFIGGNISIYKEICDEIKDEWDEMVEAYVTTFGDRDWIY